MVNVNRQAAVYNPGRIQTPIHVFGCGGIGSRVAEGLVRMGFGVRGVNPIHLYDGDSFEPHNLANQWVHAAQVGVNKQHKVHAVYQNMQYIEPSVAVSLHPRMIENVEDIRGVVFICTDTMQSRRDIVESILADSPLVSHIIETRMDANTGIVHFFRPRDVHHVACWKMYWHGDAMATNMQGCSGAVSILSAVLGTAMMALRCLEVLAHSSEQVKNSMWNRWYLDFATGRSEVEYWDLTRRR